MTIADFVKLIKRENQYGSEDVTNDARTLDIIQHLHFERKKVAKEYPYNWLIDTFSVNLTAGVQIVSLPATMDRLIAIDDGAGSYFRKVTIKDALQYLNPGSNSAYTPYLGHFINLGLDSSNNNRIKVFGMPQVSGTYTAYGLKKVADLTVSDISALTTMSPFPDEITKILIDLVGAKIQKHKSNDNWLALYNAAWSELKNYIDKDQSDPADEATTPPPDIVRIKRAIQRNGGVI